ncbi:MAG: hypothetical protein EHM58_02150 [Ignavibacteriae bacterium]|nr:MAG: hypothetical protein EHM58_02150 [Ignavibacteriota bacterium]
MPELIFQNRVSPKKIPDNIVSRKRLLDKMLANKQKSVIIVESPAGYGKTTLVQDFLLTSDIQYCWYYATEDVNNFYTFISYIIHSIRKLQENFGGNIFEVIESLRQSMSLPNNLNTIITTVLGVFINEFLQCFKNDVYLVIDDLHKLEEDEWLNLTFKNLIADLPENLHIIITTRTSPKFDTAVLSAKRNLLYIGSKELYFDNKEIILLLEKVYSINYREEDISAFGKKINGWITGIHLVLQSYGKDFYKATFGKNELPENIFYFFANDIFNDLDDDVKTFLINTALLENFNPETCNNILNISNSQKIISYLLRKNIFIESTESFPEDTSSKNTCYNYHGLFKQFLVTKLKKTLTGDEVCGLSKKIYTYYKNHDDLESSIKFALLCKEYECAIEIIIKLFPSLFDELRFNTLWNWLSEIPEKCISNNYLLKFYKGKLLKSLKGDINNSCICFRECLMLNEFINNEDLLTDCIVQLTDVYRLLGNADEALFYLNDAIEKIHKPENKVILYYWQASINYRLGPIKYDEVVDIINKCLSLLEENGIKGNNAEIFNLLGNIYLDKGELVKAFFYYELVIKNEKNIYKKFQALNLIQLLSSAGEYVKAKAYLDEAYEISQKYPSAFFERNFLRIKAMFCLECGDYEECINSYWKLIDIEIKNNTPQFIFWYYLLMGEVSTFLNKYEIAAQFYELAAKYIIQNDEYELLEYELRKTILLNKSQTDPEFEKLLLKTLKYYESHNMLNSKVQLELYLADYYFKNGSLDAALVYLTSSLSVSSNKKYVSFLEQNYLNFRYLFDLAFSYGIEKNLINNCKLQLFEKINYQWLSEDCKLRLKNELECLYDIKLFTFGSIELFVRGVPITEERWIRKKSKLILVYLLLNPEKKFTKDKMMDMFFSDLSAESAENIFHQAITNIRNCVKPVYKEFNSGMTSVDKPKSKKDKKTGASTFPEINFVIYEDKILRLNEDYYYKVDAIDFNKLYNKVKSSESSIDIKEDSATKAIRLYNGDFLAGQYEQWCEEMREEYLNKYIVLCETLINIYLKKKKDFELTVYAEKLLKVDKLNEDAYFNLIQAYVNIGNINLARSKYSNMMKVFCEELGEKPSCSVLDKIKKILL